MGSDFGVLQACFTEPGAVVSPECRGADLDGNLLVDHADLDRFRACFSGAMGAIQPGCADLSMP